VSAPPEFGELNSSKLTALIFELASQLHIERGRRLALEAALVGRGVLTAADIDAVGEDPSYRRQASEAADVAVRKMLLVLSESTDARTPLRAEASGSEGGESP
jgi:hypothetical protein